MGEGEVEEDRGLERERKRIKRSKMEQGTFREVEEQKLKKKGKSNEEDGTKRRG
jgi:hypothetical protein